MIQENMKKTLILYMKQNNERLGRSPPLKPTKVTLFTMILYNTENSIRDIRPFCRPLFCHSSVAKHTSALLQLVNS